MATLAPASASRRAKRRPNPLVAPVTKAALPARSLDMKFLLISVPPANTIRRAGATAFARGRAGLSFAHANRHRFRHGLSVVLHRQTPVGEGSGATARDGVPDQLARLSPRCAGAAPRRGSQGVYAREVRRQSAGQGDG